MQEWNWRSISPPPQKKNQKEREKTGGVAFQHWTTRCPNEPITIKTCQSVATCLTHLHFRLVWICYRPQRSCGKVMFLHLSVILSTGGVCLSACWDTTPPGQTPPPTGQTPPLGRHPLLGRTPPPADGYCSGLYAYYWNAFFFLIKLYHNVLLYNIARSQHVMLPPRRHILNISHLFPDFFQLFLLLTQSWR